MFDCTLPLPFHKIATESLNKKKLNCCIFVSSTIIQNKCCTAVHKLISFEHKGKRFYSLNVLKCLLLKFKILGVIKFL